MRKDKGSRDELSREDKLSIKYWECEIGPYTSLQDKMPDRPYCTDNPRQGLLIRPRDVALTKKYIQFNPVHQKVFLTFDVDYCFAWEDLRDTFTPMPACAVWNKKNGHAHLIYVLSEPVYTTSAAHFWPLKYLAAIESAYRQKLKADLRYSGLITKNPWNDFWDTLWLSRYSYGLDHLADFAPNMASLKSTKQPREEIAGLGRNCAVFENVRLWSYRAIRSFWSKGLMKWRDEVYYRCSEENAKFEVPLYAVELRQIAKSIARWTWRRLTLASFSNWQKKNANRRWFEESQKDIGLDMLMDGMTTLEVSQELGVSQRTCQRWKRLIVPSREIILPEEYRGAEGSKRLNEAEGLSLSTYYRHHRENVPDDREPPLSVLKPWDDEGISRATWYRRHNE